MDNAKEKSVQKNKTDNVSAASTASLGAEKVSSASQSSDDDGAVEMIRKFMAEKLGFLEKKTDEESSDKKGLDEVSVDGIVRFIQSHNCPSIVVMAGAGISTSAGIPDFRSPGSGLYDNLAQYNLPHPQAIFEIDFFKENPAPFFTLAKNMFPGSYRPTLSHYFVRLLHEKGLLLRHYTQNIDGLEKVAGVPTEKVVEAHGTFFTSHCLSCRKEYPLEWIKEKILDAGVPKCENCAEVVKPDIVFFGEPLPERFFKLAKADFPAASLVIIMGSSLAVQPFASLIDRAKSHVPRLLINREKVGHKNKLMTLLGLGGGGLDFDSEKKRDVALLGECDAMVRLLADKLGWTDDLEALQADES